MNPDRLLPDERLDRSDVVSNNRMNRERVALGSNGYESDLGFNLIERLKQIHQQNGRVRWLDLCCGWGNAVIDAGMQLRESTEVKVEPPSLLLGIDLVGMFSDVPSQLDFVRLEQHALRDFTSDEPFDLITCVHGLHYVGDKLGVLSKYVQCLGPNGALFTNIDLNNLRSSTNATHDGSPIDFRAALISSGFKLTRKNRLLSFENGEAPFVPFSLRYVGADDQAGPNYTGQEVVDSYYVDSP